MYRHKRRKKNAAHTSITLWWSTCQNQIFNRWIQTPTCINGPGFSFHVWRSQITEAPSKRADNRVHIKNPARLTRTQSLSGKLQMSNNVSCDFRWILFPSKHCEKMFVKEMSTRITAEMLLHVILHIYIYFLFCSVLHSSGFWPAAASLSWFSYTSTDV